MRREPVLEDLTGPCPHCGECSWIDLGVVPMAARFRDEEVEAARIARTVGSRAIVSVLVGAFVTIAVASGSGATTLLAVPVLALLTVGAVMATLTRGGRSVARRWHRPALRWTPATRLACGVATAEARVAPLSGRPAIAWLVAVRYEGANPRRRVHATSDADWALVEQRCGTLDVEGKRFRDGVVVDVELHELVGECAEADAWLRTRGLEPTDGLQLFEGIIANGDLVEVRANDEGSVPICTQTTVELVSTD